MEEANARAIEVKAHKRKVRKPVMSELPVIIAADIYHDGMRDNPDYVEIGVENTDTLAIRPARMYIRRIVRHKFVLKSSLQTEGPDRRIFIIAPLPETIIHKGMASESLLADILINKYTYDLPFHRQIQKYKELGVVLSDATINAWFVAVCSRLRPLYDRLREQIMSKDYIQVDESTLPVIDNERHRAVKGYMWEVKEAGLEADAIRPLALGRKNYLFCGNHDAAVRAAIVYSLFASCQAANVDTRDWLEDVLRRLP